MAQTQSNNRDKEFGLSSSQGYAARPQGLLLAYAAAGAISFWPFTLRLARTSV